MPAFMFGPLGAMVPLESVQPDVAVSVDRPGSEFRSAGGLRSVMRGRYAARSWSLGYGWKGPDVVRVLSAAAHGLLGACWLYDSAAARENMLPAHLTAGTGAAVLVDGLPLGGLSAGHSVQVPVLAGRDYVVSAWSTAASGATVVTYQIDGGTPVNVTAPPGTGARSAGAGFTPTTDAILTVTVPGAGVSGLRVHEGAPDGAWFPGHGTPCKVSVKDPERTLQLVTDQESRSAYSVTLQEVGRPGII